MIDRELEAKRRLVALARKKAILDGTTLEAIVEKWLAHYINETEDVNNGQMEAPGPRSTPTPQATIARTVRKVNKTGQSIRQSSDARRGKNTRSAAYRRLLGVMSDSSDWDS